MDLLLPLTQDLLVVFACVLFGIFGLLGVVAVVSPKHFERLANVSSHWVDSSKLFAFLERRYDIDSYILPYSRVLGVLMLLSLGMIGAYIFW